MATSRTCCRVLVVDDEVAMREVLQARLEGWGYPVKTAGSTAEAGTLVDSFAPDVVISDLVLPDGTGLDLLRAYHRTDRMFVIVTAYGTVDTAVQAMKGGAAEFLTKPLDYTALRALLDAHDARVDRGDPVETTSPSLTTLVGSSPSISSVRRKVSAVAAGSTTVMVVGESGTGKELVARAIHLASERREGPFVAVNAAAIPASLVEAELLGHERGAFTGADAARAGLFEQAHRGSLFLDEITEMPLPLQAKLLRVLEDGRVRRVGGHKEIACDVRVVSATNRPPFEAVEAGLLRSDLYHRLGVFRIDLPPLRERREDIPELCAHLLAELALRDGHEVPVLSEGAVSKLHGHYFPGNVRELRNVLERARVLSRGRRIEAEHVVLDDPKGNPGSTTEGITIPASVTAADAERILILETLKRVGNNKAEAARRLGLDVKTIRNKLKSFDSSA